MGEPSPFVKTLASAQLAPADWQRLEEVSRIVWPTSSNDSPRYASEPAVAVDWPGHQESRVHLVRVDGAIVAHARSFGRRVCAAQAELDVMALAGVFCHPQWRGRGYGAAVAVAAFERVDQGEFTVALFQTGVPEFYRKLGCRTIDNPLINSRSTFDRRQRPFWNDHAMIYPATFDSPTGDIDTLGPGW